MSANAMISSNRASISWLFKPSTEAFMYTFSCPVNSGLKPEPSSSKAATRPLVWMLPLVGVSVPQIICKRVDLPLPLHPIMPTVSPFLTSKETSLSAQNSRKYCLGCCQVKRCKRGAINCLSRSRGLS